MSGDEPFLPDNGFCGCMATPFNAHCGWFTRSASNWEFRALLDLLLLLLSSLEGEKEDVELVMDDLDLVCL